MRPTSNPVILQITNTCPTKLKQIYYTYLSCLKNQHQQYKWETQKKGFKIYLMNLWDRKGSLYISCSNSFTWRHGFLNAPNHNTKATTTFQSFNCSSVCMFMPLEQIVRLKNWPSCLIWHLIKVMIVRGQKWVWYQWQIIQPSKSLERYLSYR